MRPRSRNTSSSRISRVALLTFFVAVFCFVVAHGRRQRQRRAAAYGDDDAEDELEILPPVRPLPERRKRALTPSPSDAGAATTDTNSRSGRNRGRRNTNGIRLSARSQDQSRLFAKLPFEIRAMVWWAAVAGEVVHVVGSADTVDRRRIRDGREEEYLRLSHFKCLGRCNAVCQNRRNYDVKCWDCWSLDGDRRGGRRGKGWARGRGMVGVLQSCQRIYAEAIDSLYQGNTFDFHCMDNLVPFSATILPQRLNSIRSLRLHQYFGFPLTDTIQSSPVSRGSKAHAEWWRLWSLVASMDGLRDLKVSLLIHFGKWPQPMDLEQETTLLEPLLLVTRPRSFTVYRTWLRPQPGFETEDMPFEIEQWSPHNARHATGH